MLHSTSVYSTCRGVPSRFLTGNLSKFIFGALMLLSLAPAQSALAQFTSYQDGPNAVCVNQLAVFDMRTDVCNNVEWEIERVGTGTVLKYQEFGCGIGITYKAYLQDFNFVDLSSNPVGDNGSCSGIMYLINGGISVRFLQPGTYKMKTKPLATWGFSLCSNTEKSVTVVLPNNATPLVVADNLSGERDVRCAFNGNVTYSIPAVPGATSYRWDIAPVSSGQFISGSFGGNSSIVTTVPNATANFGSVNAPANGTLRVTAFGPCWATGSRTFNIFRISPSSSVSSYGGSSCSRCFTAPGGSSYSWSLSAPSALYIDGSSSSQSVCVRSRSAGSWGGYLSVSYNGGCGGERINTGTGVSISACSGRLSAEKRTATEEFSESVSPNPANDVLSITHPAENFRNHPDRYAWQAGAPTDQ